MDTLRSDRDYERALKAIEALWDAEPGSPDHQVLDRLVQLVEQYEAMRWPVEDPAEEEDPTP